MSSASKHELEDSDDNPYLEQAFTSLLFFDENEDLSVLAIQALCHGLARASHQCRPNSILIISRAVSPQHLSHDKRNLKQAIAFGRQTLDQNVIIIAGCGAPSARESKKLYLDAKEASATYVLVSIPSIWPPQITKDAIPAFHHNVRT
ncbi:hypothetical protein JVT61DRAFT_13560 [Boletus reticuloceps]|uniref:Uncharacterized protein n=1 Tax=Boletus reticuloceps TaxID=495285 RepID=A0A8I2YDB6_9AGAM|nr:hypothetical protein JVT61DRAFT_13560 [Boletus reticuloceps]